jgi:hypothetical protein
MIARAAKYINCPKCGETIEEPCSGKTQVPHNCIKTYVSAVGPTYIPALPEEDKVNEKFKKLKWKVKKGRWQR